MRKQNTEGAVPLHAVPERRTKRCSPRSRPGDPFLRMCIWWENEIVSCRHIQLYLFIYFHLSTYLCISNSQPQTTGVWITPFVVDPSQKLSWKYEPQENATPQDVANTSGKTAKSIGNTSQIMA